MCGECDAKETIRLKNLPHCQQCNDEIDNNKDWRSLCRYAFCKSQYCKKCVIKDHENGVCQDCIVLTPICSQWSNNDYFDWDDFNRNWSGITTFFHNNCKDCRHLMSDQTFWHSSISCKECNQIAIKLIKTEIDKDVPNIKYVLRNFRPRNDTK